VHPSLQQRERADVLTTGERRKPSHLLLVATQARDRKRGEHRFRIPDGSRWGDVKAASTNLGEVLTKAMRAVAHANDELRGVFTVDWNQPAPDGSGKPLIPNEVVHALVQHFEEHDLSNRSVPSDVLGRAYEYLIKQFADDAGAKAGEFFTPPEVVDTLVRILEPRPGDTVYDPTAGSGGMLVHAADLLRERGQYATSARYYAQEMNSTRGTGSKESQCSIGSEHDIRIQPRRTPRGQPACDPGNDRNRRGHCCDRRSVGRLDAEQQGRHQPGYAEGARKSDDDADDGGLEALLHHQRDHAGTRRAERHPNADLAAALRHHIGEHTVGADGRE
jgi:hypothetical protein